MLRECSPGRRIVEGIGEGVICGGALFPADRRPIAYRVPGTWCIRREKTRPARLIDAARRVSEAVGDFAYVRLDARRPEQVDDGHTRHHAARRCSVPVGCKWLGSGALWR